jgi:hypothetical protein
LDAAKDWAFYLALSIFRLLAILAGECYSQSSMGPFVQCASSLSVVLNRQMRWLQHMAAVLACVLLW